MRIIIDENYDGTLLKDYLYKALGFSSASVKKVKYRDGGILLNGESVTVRRVLRRGDVLTLCVEDTPEDENKYTVPVDIPLDVVFEDEYITVVNKAPFMPSHPSLGHKDDTVANALAYRYRARPYVFRPVNRLDRDTSGLILTANDKISAGKLYRSMMRKEIKKSYTAILCGAPEEDCGVISAYMCREGDSIVKRRVCNEGDDGAKLAITEYRVLSRTKTHSLVEAFPVTGRTHQLRVHFANIGCPILGDTMYGSPSELINRQALHASALTFPHPADGGIMTLHAKLSDDIEYAVSELGL